MVWCSENYWRARIRRLRGARSCPSTVDLEARGEIRGGRFVAGFIGEQYALPEAVDGLRAVRRQPKEPETIIVAAADPLNLVGILTPGPRISPFTQQVIVYRSGVPIETRSLGSCQEPSQGQSRIVLNAA